MSIILLLASVLQHKK